MSRKYFGTDGVRGLYGGPVVNEKFATQLGFAATQWLRGPGERRKITDGTPQPALERRNTSGIGRVLLGRDTRASGAPLEAAIARGFRAGGAEVVSLGVLPTPALARAVWLSGARMGVMITASHNPAADNGIKFFGNRGLKLTDLQEEQIEGYLDAAVMLPEPWLESRPGAVEDYLAAARSLLPHHALAGWRIALDTAHGATCVTSPVALRTLGAELVAVGDAPDGRNINDGVGSEHPELLAAKVRESGARVGIAHDGDGDRCLMCDERGGILDGDELLAILAVHALTTGTLDKQVLVATVQSNLGLDAAVAAAGGRVVRTPVGDRYVIERMLAEGATLGGESSGHILCAGVSPTGDGLVAALRVLGVMLATGRPLSELRRVMAKFPQRSRALTVREKRPFEALATLTAAVHALERELGTRGRVLVRYSGTEPKLRLLVEGPTEDQVRAGLSDLEAAARVDLDIVDPAG
ncbi:MAG: phosphoglucosamine mutase [Verrucomicrobia bacterium]|nr:phosphoglucosamine mutase [Verrucomicrobiota bacterium]